MRLAVSQAAVIIGFNPQLVAAASKVSPAAA